MSRRFIFLALIAFAIVAKAQSDTEFMTGLLPDDGTYNTLPEKAELITRDYISLPSSHSLKSFAPVVRSQSQFGTCTSWATVYAGRTIAEAVSRGWTDKDRITAEAFSPIYVYAQIKHADDPNCRRGSHIFNALAVLKNQGTVKMSDFEELCAGADEISYTLKQKAGRYKIDDYFTLFKLDNILTDTKVSKVKKALAEDCPVVIAMWLPQSFHQAGGDWSGIDVNPDDHGYHAMCVVGYDDNHSGGGAFEIMNSWGQNWGNGGFTWVKYDDFGKFVDQAYEIYVKKDREDRMDNQVIGNTFAGSIDLKLSTGETMKATYNALRGTYRLSESYISGTRYRAYISNNEPAYVYVIGSDLDNNVSIVFPSQPTISPALTYKSSSIAIPDERFFIEMDNTEGTDFMCVLYCSEPIDIERVKSAIKSTPGTISQKVKTALGDKYVSPETTSFDSSRISFEASSCSGTVVPLIVEIDHK